jgi:flagellar protein FliT
MDYSTDHSTDQNTLIDRLLELTVATKYAATLADWPEAARLTEERSPLFRMLTREQDAESMAKISKIRAIDAAIAAEAQSARSELQSEYNAAMGKIRATNQYHKAAML